MAGHETTLPITLEEMVYHFKSVVRATERALVVVDMPFGSYQGNSKKAQKFRHKNNERNWDTAKVEGGSEIIESVQRIFKAGIPVMGHLGLLLNLSTSLGHT